MNAEQYLLNGVAEECAEIAHIASKSIRFGLDSSHPAPGSPQNLELLNKEINDLYAIVEMLQSMGVQIGFRDPAHVMNKKARVRFYSQESIQSGRLQEELP